MPFTLDSNSAAIIPSRVSILPSADLRGYQDRVATFRLWASELMNPYELAASGFFYTGYEDLVRCAFCGIGILHWAEGERAEYYHGGVSPDCGFVKAQAAGKIAGDFPRLRAPTAALVVNEDPENVTALMRNLGVNEAVGPLSLELTTIERRLPTFGIWGPIWAVQPECLAEAGFYAEDRYKTTCFYCGGSLTDWQLNDDPWVKHAQSFPLCPFVNLLKGQDFVDRACQSGASALPPPADMESLDEKGGKTEEKKSPPKVVERQESETCVICLDEKRTIVFLPCCHLVTCVSCALAVSACPICRMELGGILSVNF